MLRRFMRICDGYENFNTTMPNILRRISKQSSAMQAVEHLFPQARTYGQPPALRDVKQKRAVFAARAQALREHAAIARAL